MCVYAPQVQIYETKKIPQHTSLGNDTQTVPPASISFLFCGRTLTTTRTPLLALSPTPPPAPNPAAAMPLPLGVLRSFSALDSDPAVEAAGERRPGVRALVGKGGVAMFSLENAEKSPLGNVSLF